MAVLALAVGVAGVDAQVRPVASEAVAPAWEAFDDPVLQRLVDEALDANPDLRSVAARIGGARADRLEARLDLAPAITASGGYTRQQVSGAAFPVPGGSGAAVPVHGLWEAGIRMSWEVDVFGRGRRSLEGRTALLDAAEEDVGDARLTLAAAVTEAYVLALGERERLAVAERNAENQRRTLAVTEERLEAGRGTALDTERARAQLSATLASIAGLDGSATAAEYRLATLVGRPAGPVPELADAPALRDALPETVALPDADLLVRLRPDLRGSERRLAARSALAGAAKADYLPRVWIQGAAGYTATAFDALGSSGSPRYAVGPVISWPLLDLGRVKAGADAARAAEAEARARYEGDVLRALQEVRSAEVAYERARERLGHLEDAATAIERATELAILRFEEGATGFLEVLDAEARQLQVQDGLAAARTDAVAALVALHRAVGGSWGGADGPAGLAAQAAR